MGRPSTYSEDVGNRICEWIANGNSLRSFCAADGAPAFDTIMRWRRENQSFDERYARAREDQGDNDADAVAQVRDKVAAGELTPEQGRVMIDSLKWTAGKRLPKRYGDRLDVAVSGDVSFGERLAGARKAIAAPGDSDA